MSYDRVIVGAGFAGSVLAERLATQAGERVLVIDRRPHVGGNAYDEVDESGVRVHRYGPHIFHTNSDAIWQYLSQFTAWRQYSHRVLACVDDELVPIPINRTTVNALYGLRLETDAEVQAFYDSVAEPRERKRTSEDVVVSQVGKELYRKFFRGYTRKQWGLDPSQLDASVTARIPTRTDADDRYFTDRHQAMPLAGYTQLFQRMLDHPLIEVRVDTPFEELPGSLRYGGLIYTGPVDAYFGWRFGHLPYRSLEFRFETHPVERFQPVATVNYPDEAVPFTRITEFKHLTGQVAPSTSVVYEFPRSDGDPYYPIPRPESAAMYERYRALADATDGVQFVGRLATYKYYNMDQVVGQALAAFNRLAGRSSQVA